MTHSDLIREMHRRIDRFALQRIQDVWPCTTWTKFFDVDQYVSVAAEHALRLSEYLPNPNARCLDLGCGFGYVALALECLGHKCVAWDAPAEVLRNVQHAIPVSERIFLSIERRDDKEFLKKFDLIILHGVWPMRDAGGWWEWKDYRTLGERLVAALNPGGLLEIICNRGEEIPTMCNPDLWAMLASEELTIDVTDNVITARRAAPVCVGS